jgi:hypothetical protein
MRCLVARAQRTAANSRVTVAAEAEVPVPLKGDFQRMARKRHQHEKLALRELDSRHLSDINDLTYRPRPVTSFKQFAERWQRTALPNLKLSSQPPIRSQLKRHLIPVLGTGAMKDLTAELLQSFVTDCSKLSPKTTKNLDPVP